MIGNQTKGRGFRGLLNYLENQKDAKLIGGNMGSNNAPALAREFKISRQLNPEADRVVYHASLSLPDNERLDEATWNEIAHRYLEEMGFDSNQYVVYRHSNTEHDHIHICASRIRLDNGKIVHDSWDYKRSETIIRQLEQDYSLQQTHSSHEKLSRNSSIGQQKRLEREQEEYINGKRQTQQKRPIKEQLQELIDRATIDKPTMPQLVERLQLQGVEVRHGLTRNGKSKGISYSWNDQKFSGTSLGPAYTFPGLQKHKFIDYQPQRDDERIEHLLNNRVGRTVESQQPINAIAKFIEQSVVESTLVETLPQLIEKLSQYRQQLEAVRTTFDDLESAIAEKEQRLLSQRTVDPISDFIERSVVESSLSETLPQLTEQLSGYQQQLKEGTSTLDDLGEAIAEKEQRLSSQRTVDAIALNQTPTRTTDEPKLTQNQTAELYKYYSADLQNLLVTDRDKEIAIRALLDHKPVQDVEEIIKASPAGWTTDEARALVLIANNQLVSEQSEPEQQLSEEQYQIEEFLTVAVPIAVELINWQLRESGENSLRFKRATLEKQGKELVFTHDERGEIFRVAVNRNQSGELEYSPINVGEVEREDIQLWQKAERVLQQIIEEKQQQERRQSKGLSL